MKVPTDKREIHAYLASTLCDERLDIRLPKELLKAAQALADEQEWPLSYAVRYSLAVGIAKG